MQVITVGRSSQCDETITNDSQVSRFHAQIINENGEYFIIDTDSTNGTFVNGQRISGRQKLHPRDVVRIGNTTIPWLMYFSAANTRRKQQYVENSSSEFQTSINNKNNVDVNGVDSINAPKRGNIEPSPSPHPVASATSASSQENNNSSTIAWIVFATIAIIGIILVIAANS